MNRNYADLRADDFVIVVRKARQFRPLDPEEMEMLIYFGVVGMRRRYNDRRDRLYSTGPATVPLGMLLIMMAMLPFAYFAALLCRVFEIDIRPENGVLITMAVMFAALIYFAVKVIPKLTKRHWRKVDEQLRAEGWSPFITD